jgi:hypothetical protein
LPVSFISCASEHVDNLGAYTASRPETGLLIPSGYIRLRLLLGNRRTDFTPCLFYNALDNRTAPSILAVLGTRLLLSAEILTPLGPGPESRQSSSKRSIFQRRASGSACTHKVQTIRCTHSQVVPQKGGLR